MCVSAVFIVASSQLVVSFCCSCCCGCNQPCSSDYFVNCSDTKASISNAKPLFAPLVCLERLFRCCLCYLVAKDKDRGGRGDGLQSGLK